MVWDRVVGQERVKRILQAALKSGRVPHALLFHGPSGVGKDAVALAMAQALVCERDPSGCGECPQCRRVAGFVHPDMIAVFPAPKSINEREERSVLDQWAAEPYRRPDPWPSATISIDRVRSIRRDAGMSSFEGGARVTLIVDAHRMRPEAANALLKILEEPPPRTYFILTSERPNMLLPTIVSRCQQVRFAPLAEKDIAAGLRARRQVPDSQAQLLSRLACGSFRRALELLDEDIQARRDKAVDLLRQCLRNEHEQIEYIEESLEGEDADSLRELLTFVALWLRDAMRWQALQGEAGGLANEDSVDTLARFVEALPQIDYEAAVDEVERALFWLGRNVHRKLILVVLFRRLRSCLLVTGRV